MNDLVVLSFNLAQNAVIGPPALLPPTHPQSTEFQNPSQQGGFGQPQLPPPAYAPDLINPNISYPQLVGGGASAQSTAPNTEARAQPAVYETIAAIYEAGNHLGEETRGTQVSFEV